MLSSWAIKSKFSDPEKLFLDVDRRTEVWHEQMRKTDYKYNYNALDLRLRGNHNWPLWFSYNITIVNQSVIHHWYLIIQLMS